MKELLLGFLALYSITGSAQNYTGEDANGNPCEIEIVRDQFIEHETPERDLGHPSAGQHLTTTERISTVNFKYLKERFFGDSEIIIKGIQVRSEQNTMWSGYSYIQSEGQTQSIYNRHLGLEDDFALILEFDKRNKFGAVQNFKYESWDNGEILVDCSI